MHSGSQVFVKPQLPYKVTGDTTDVNRKWAVFLWNLSSHYVPHIYSYAFLSSVETNCLKNWDRQLPWHAKCSLLVFVRCSQTSLAWALYVSLKSASTLHVARDSGETRHAGRTKTFGAFSLRGISIVGSMFFFPQNESSLPTNNWGPMQRKGVGFWDRYETTVHEVTCRQRVVSVRERGKTKLTRGLAKRGERQK